MATRIKKDDEVMVIRGRDRGLKGRVLKVLDGGERLLIEGVQRVKRHQNARQFRETGIVEKEAPIHRSNVMLVDPKEDKPTRVRAGENKDGDKVRVAVKSGSVLD